MEGSEAFSSSLVLLFVSVSYGVLVLRDGMLCLDPFRASDQDIYPVDFLGGFLMSRKCFPPEVVCRTYHGS